MMRLFTCVRGTYAMCMDGNQRTKLGLSSPPALFKAGSLIWCPVLWSRWSQTSWGFSYLRLSSPCRSAVSADTCYRVLLCMMSGLPNPGPHPRVTSALPPELLSSPGIIFPFGISITSLWAQGFPGGQSHSRVHGFLWNDRPRSTDSLWASQWISKIPRRYYSWSIPNAKMETNASKSRSLETSRKGFLATKPCFLQEVT